MVVKSQFVTPQEYQQQQYQQQCQQQANQQQQQHLPPPPSGMDRGRSSGRGESQAKEVIFRIIVFKVADYGPNIRKTSMLST